MNAKSKAKLLDIIYLCIMILPLLCGMILKILFSPATEGISITGALIYFRIPMPIQDFLITETQINSVIVIIFLAGLCLFLTNGIKSVPNSWRQHLAEMIVEKCDGLVNENMGERFMGFAPFIAAIMGLSMFSSIITLIGLYPPTSDVNTTAGWAIFVFVIITYYKLKGGIGPYLKGFTEPIVVLTPLNIIGEVATPVSMAFRHYGNVLSGCVVSVLLSAALAKVSSLILGWLPGVLGNIAILQIGIPAVFSLYFDLFSGGIQAFIFAMLTMMNISGAFSEEDYEKRMKKKLARKQKKAAKAA